MPVRTALVLACLAAGSSAQLTMKFVGVRKTPLTGNSTHYEGACAIQFFNPFFPCGFHTDPLALFGVRVRRLNGSSLFLDSFLLSFSFSVCVYVYLLYGRYLHICRCWCLCCTARCYFSGPLLGSVPYFSAGTYFQFVWL